MIVSKNRLSAAVVCVLVPSVLLGRGGSDREGNRFVPEDHFPSPALCYFSVESSSGLLDRLRGTLYGQLVTHPGWKQVFRGILKAAEGHIEGLELQVMAVTGKSPAQLLDTFRGQIAFCVRGINPAAMAALSVPDATPVGLVEAALALELGETRDDILAVVGRLRSLYEELSGSAVEERRVGEIDTLVWPSPLGTVFQAEMGTHLLFVTSPEMLRDIHRAFGGNGEGAPLKESVLYRELSGPLAVADRQILCEINLEAIRGLVFPLISLANGAEDIKRAAQFTGVGHLTSLGWALGFRDGGAEIAAHLGMRGGARGVMEALQSGLAPVGPVDDALRKIPAAATEIRALRVAPGRILRNLNRLARDRIPELGEEIDSVFTLLQENTGISVEEDIFSLGELTLFSFTVDPPAGSLLADRLHLVRTEEFLPYWKLAVKVAAVFEGAVRALEANAGKVEYISLVRDGDPQGAMFPGWAPSEFEIALLAAAAVQPGGSLARWKGEEGWTVVSSLPQAALRYADYYSRLEKLGKDAAFAALARERLPGGSLGNVFRGGRSFLWAYNSFLAVASVYSPILSRFGVDLAAAPPGEVFLEHARPGYLNLESKPEGFTFRAHRLGGSTAALGGVAVAGFVAGLVVPSWMNARKSAYEIQCTNNLRGLQQVAFLYAQKQRGRFPRDPEGSLASIQLLLDSEAGSSLEPEMLICPEGEAAAAEAEGGRIVLTERNWSYEMAPWPLRTTDRGMLFYDRRPCHDGRRVVVMTNGRVESLDESEFQARLAEERQRFGRGEARPGARRSATGREDRR